MSNNKHMNAHDRIIVENGLDAHDSFKTVAKNLNKDCTTISKEVKKNSWKNDRQILSTISKITLNPILLSSIYSSIASVYKY